MYPIVFGDMKIVQVEINKSQESSDQYPKVTEEQQNFRSSTTVYHVQLRGDTGIRILGIFQETIPLILSVHFTFRDKVNVHKLTYTVGHVY